MSTQKQREFIAHLIEKRKDDHLWFGQLWESTPINNEDYPNTKADYRRLILADRLKNLTFSEADTVIKAYLHQVPGYKIQTARAILEKRII